MIEIKSLNKKYGSKVVLRDVRMELHEGNVYGLMGENGAGKSTLFNCIVGLLKYQGEINIDKTTKIGYLSDSPFFYSCIKGLEYIEFCLRARGIKVDYSEIHNLNVKFSLPLNEYASEYSLGMKKRLAFMAIILQKNDFFILDEPFNGLDLAGCILVKRIIEKIRGDNKTVLISSHIISSLTDLCDSIKYLHNGEIVKDYTGMDAQEIENDIARQYINL